MDFLELVTGARTCRRFREAEGMPAGMLDWYCPAAIILSFLTAAVLGYVL